MSHQVTGIRSKHLLPKQPKGSTHLLENIVRPAICTTSATITFPKRWWLEQCCSSILPPYWKPYIREGRVIFFHFIFCKRILAVQEKYGTTKLDTCFTDTRDWATIVTSKTTWKPQLPCRLLEVQALLPKRNICGLRTLYRAHEVGQSLGGG